MSIFKVTMGALGCAAILGSAVAAASDTAEPLVRWNSLTYQVADGGRPSAGMQASSRASLWCRV